MVNDVPLLAEVGLAPTYHLVVVVQAGVHIRLARLARDRGMSRAEAQRRIAAQADDARRAAVADVLLANEGTLDDLHAAVDALWRDRLVPFEDNVRHRRAVRAGRVTLVEPNPSWPQQYARLADRIRHAIAPADLRIDHIGSTAMTGLAAKDVIDIQLSVPSLADADGVLAERLADAGFPRLPGDWWDSPRPAGGDRWAKRLHGNADPARPVHLHLRVTGSPGWRYALLMRDHLRADPDRRAAYLVLKRELAASAPDSGAYARRRTRGSTRSTSGRRSGPHAPVGAPEGRVAAATWVRIRRSGQRFRGGVSRGTRPGVRSSCAQAPERVDSSSRRSVPDRRPS